MRKLTRRGINLFFILFTLMLFLWGISIVLRDLKEPIEPDKDAFFLDSNITDKETMVQVEIESEILIEFLSVNYLEDKEYLMRVEVGGEQIGIIYFDENGEIRFDGDKEKFEDAIFKAFDARRVK